MDDRIIALFKRGVSYGSIAAKLKVTKSAVYMRLYRLRKGGEIKRPKNYRHTQKFWTDAEYALARKLRYEDGLTAAQIGKKLGRPAQSVRGKFLHSREGLLAVRPEQRIEIPAFVLADRDRRYSSPYRDLSSAVFGDPVIGQSALDRRRATLSQKEAA